MLPFLLSPPQRVVIFNPAGRYTARQVAEMRAAGTPVVAGIPTVAAAAECVPVHDAIRAARAARGDGSWLLGPNTLGLCVPDAGRAATRLRLARLLRAGGRGPARAQRHAPPRDRTATDSGWIRQRAVIHAGGDTVIGRNPHEWLAALADDPGTAAVLYCGEIGGDKEYALAEAVSALPRPVVATLVGRQAPADRQRGHAGALIGAERETSGPRSQPCGWAARGSRPRLTTRSRS